MENEKLVKYVNERRIAGLSDKQIATSLGMSLKHLKSMLGEKIAQVQTSRTPTVARVGMSRVSGPGEVQKEKVPEETKPIDTEKTNSINDFLPEDLKNKDKNKDKNKKKAHGWVDAE